MILSLVAVLLLATAAESVKTFGDVYACQHDVQVRCREECFDTLPAGTNMDTYAECDDDYNVKFRQVDIDCFAQLDNTDISEQATCYQMLSSPRAKRKAHARRVRGAVENAAALGAYSKCIDKCSRPDSKRCFDGCPKPTHFQHVVCGHSQKSEEKQKSVINEFLTCFNRAVEEGKKK